MAFIKLIWTVLTLPIGAVCMALGIGLYLIARPVMVLLVLAILYQGFTSL